MAIVRCERGHHYNDSQTPTCPYCEGDGLIGQTIPLNEVAPSVTPAPVGGMNQTEMLTPKPTVSYNNGGADIPATKFVADVQDGHTVLMNPAKQDEISINANDLPVTGWFVVVEGDHTGTDLRVHTGRNTIGRAKSNDICLDFDQKITKENACSITYDGRSNEFFITIGEDKNGIYLNNSILLQPTKITDDDVLEIGETKLVFRAFCNDKFKY